MSPPRTIIHRFTRRKNPHSKSPVLFANSPILRHPPQTMLTLPTELHARILENVSFRDLAAFRLTCRTCRSLLHSGEIIRRWLEVHGNPQQLSLYPPPQPPGFQYVLAQRWTYITAEATAKLIAKYIEHEILRHTLQRLDVHPTRSREELLETTTKEVQEKLVPLLLTMQHYLRHFANRLLDQYIPLEGGELRVHGPLHSDRQVLESYDPHHLLRMHKFWHFLYWLFNRILSRDVPLMISTADGRPVEPFNRCQLRLMLVLGNLPALRTLLSQETPKQRLRALAAFFKRIDPDLSILWNRRWGHNLVALDRPDTPDKARAVLDVRLGAGEVWMGGARDLLMERGDLSKSRRDDIGAPWQALDFLFDTCGYDALQSPPCMVQLYTRMFLRPPPS